MLLADGGGGDHGTNWSGVSMSDIWLAMSNQQTDNHWTLLTGWRRSYELTLQHMIAVRSYRENLAAAWRPEKSPAAAAYLERLDDLLEHLRQTYDAAVTNHSAFSGATLALSSARRDLEPVVTEYFANEGKLASYEKGVAERSSTGKGTSSGRPPVPDGRQTELEIRARSIMYGLSAELATARTQIRQPRLYDGTYGVEGGGRDDNSAGYAPHPVPPITPFVPDSGTSPRSSSAIATPSPHTSVGNQPTPLSTSSRTPGLILGGLDSTVGPQPPVTMPEPPSVGGTTPTTVFPSSSTPLAGPSSNVMQPIAGVGRPIKGGLPNGGARVLPPGGIIGTTPGLGLGQPVQGNRPQTVNPVGGLIGGANSPQRSGNSAYPGPSNGQTMAGPMGRASDRRKGSDGLVRWDPDNPWATAERVAPVVTPVEEPRIDPGPAIGLR